MNLASRVVGCAAGREVVTDGSLANELADDDRYALVPLGERDLKSFGLVPLFRLTAR